MVGRDVDWVKPRVADRIGDRLAVPLISQVADAFDDRERSGVARDLERGADSADGGEQIGMAKSVQKCRHAAHREAHNGATGAVVADVEGGLHRRHQLVQHERLGLHAAPVPAIDPQAIRAQRSRTGIRGDDDEMRLCRVLLEREERRLKGAPARAELLQREVAAAERSECLLVEFGEDGAV